MYEPVAQDEQLDINDSLDALVDEMTDCYHHICDIVSRESFGFTEFGLFDWRQQLNPDVRPQDELMRWYASVIYHCAIPEHFTELLIELYPDVARHLARMERCAVPSREALEMLGIFHRDIRGLGQIYDHRDVIASQVPYFPRVNDGLQDAILVGLMWHIMGRYNQ